MRAPAPCRPRMRAIGNRPGKRKRVDVSQRTGRSLTLSKRVSAALTVLVVLVAVAVIGGLSFLYVENLRGMIRTQSTEYLSEISKQVTENATNVIDAKLQLLDSASAAMDSFSNDSLAALDEALDQQSSNLGFERIAAIDSEGIWHCQGTTQRYPQLSEYVSRASLEGTAFVPAAQNINGTDYVLFFSPVDGTNVEGVTIKALGGFVRLADLGQQIAPKTFDGLSTTDIVTTSGSIIAQSDPSKSLASGFNLLADLENVQFSDGTTAQSLAADIKNGNPGICRYCLDGQEYVSYYSKMPVHDWLLFCSVPADTLDAQPDSFVKLTVLACLAVATCIVLLMGTILFVQNRSRASLMRLAYEDRVTGGPSHEKLVETMCDLQEKPHSAYAVVYANIERFKSINDRFGTEEADNLLRIVHEELSAALDDDEMAARLAADHFALLLKATSKEQVEDKLRAISLRVVDRCSTGDAPYSVRMSFGAYLVNEPGITPDILIDRANLARKSGLPHCHNPRISFYDTTLKKTMHAEQDIEARMGDALDNGEFQAYLQPQYDAQTGTITGFEALARWVQDDGTLLAPDRFIPLFERNGFIVQLDLNIFEQACRIQRRILDTGRPVLPISVNVSRTHLMSDDPMAPYREIWERYRLPKNAVAFEFTESIMYDDPDRLNQVIDELHEAGFTCSMDDFGTGYSSLGMLNRTNIDILKLDRSFLGRDKNLSERSATIIAGIISLAKGLGMNIVAEGVEYEEQLAFLRSCGCDCIQGFFFARPMPADEALRLAESAGDGNKDDVSSKDQGPHETGA